MALTQQDYIDRGLNPDHCGDFKEYMQRRLNEDPELKKEFDKLQLQRQVAKIITETRKSKGLKQSELAMKAGTSQTVISRIENGSVSVGLQMLQRIADALDARINITLSTC